jgi:hypothetical protein
MEKNASPRGRFLFGLAPIVSIENPWNKCASMGCRRSKFPGRDFCYVCLADADVRPLAKRTCDNLTAVSENGEPQ